MREDDSSRAGFSYRFPRLGIALWRPSVLTEEDLQTDWFQDMSPVNQEDERTYMYFESIVVFRAKKLRE